MRGNNKTKRKTRWLQRLCSLVLVCMMVLGGLGIAAEAAGSAKNTSRAIAIVLDNSGSMYLRGNMVPCYIRHRGVCLHDE